MVDSNQNQLWPTLYAPFRGLGTKLSHWLSPASDASSDDRAYRIAVELPGVSEDAIDISVDGGVLTVSGEKSETREDKGETWYFTERQFGMFRRSYRLPEDADPDRAEAHARNGVLEITVPRRAPKSGEARKISVRKG